MATRIIFNGQEYANAEAMPPALRTAYQQALAQLEDANQNGVPDVLERGDTGNVIVIQPSSITINGRSFDNVSSMPAPLRVLYDYLMRQAEGNQQGKPESNATGDPGPDARVASPRAQPNEDLLRALDTTEHALARVLQVLLGVAAGGVVAGGVWMISEMDASSRSQAGDLYVGIGVLVALACIAGMYISIEKRLKK